MRFQQKVVFLHRIESLKFEIMKQTPHIFKRKIYDLMLNWKQTRNGNTALLIKGARRVGKSTIAEEFARREYQS